LLLPPLFRQSGDPNIFYQRVEEILSTDRDSRFIHPPGKKVDPKASLTFTGPAF